MTTVCLAELVLLTEDPSTARYPAAGCLDCDGWPNSAAGALLVPHRARATSPHSYRKAKPLWLAVYVQRQG